jgi:hypothetical protein
METLQSIQIADDRIVFNQAALASAAEQGEIQPEYVAQIRRQQAAEAITGALAGVRTTITSAIGNVAAAARLEVRMAVFDTLHGTNYRRIRHDLIEQQKRERFEKSIGLVAVSKK